MTSTCHTATILITTKDRADLFARSLQSALDQDVKCEIVVVDDASSDHTSQLAREICPDVILVRNETAVGIIAARNQGFQVATGDIVFTLDDDAVFSSRELVGSVIAEFEKPFVGAVTIPLIDHLPDGSILQRLPIEGPVEDFPCVAIFSGGANALRRESFLACGGYCGSFRQGEERGLSLKLLDMGMIVRVAAKYHIDHYPQPRVGDRSSIVFWSARNFLHFGWRYVPFPTLIPFLLTTAARQLKNGFSKRCPTQPLAAMCYAVGDAWHTRRERSPVSAGVLYAFQELSKVSVLRLSEVTVILNKYQRALLCS